MGSVEVPSEWGKKRTVRIHDIEMKALFRLLDCTIYKKEFSPSPNELLALERKRNQFFNLLLRK